MFAVQTFLARRPPSTKKTYERALTRFAACVGTDMDHLHLYIASTPKEKLTEDLIKFADSLAGKPSTQRVNIAGVLSFLSYNDLTISKPARKQITPKGGDVFRDRAMTAPEVKRVYEYLSPIGRAALLLLFVSGMRIGELVQVKESDMDGRIIHLRSAYTKNKKARDVVMTKECYDYITSIWLPQKEDYLKSSQNRGAGLPSRKDGTAKVGVKKLQDDRIIPMSKSTTYAVLMLAFNHAGFGEKKDGMFLYHPHSLRKSFRSIVGSQSPDLAEALMGHEGYLASSYVRLDLVKEYEKIEHLLSLTSNAGMNSRVQLLEQEKETLLQRVQDLERKQQAMTILDKEQGRLTPEDHAAIAKLFAEEMRKDPRGYV